MRRSTGALFARSLVMVTAVVLLAGACSDDRPGSATESEATSTDSSEPCYERGWRDCPEEPYPFSTPLPPPEPTAIDGLYTRTVEEHLAGAPGKCTRCPPYRLEPGTQTLTFDRGRFFVEASKFKISGHFSLDGDRLRLFNDPSCVTMEGLYEWEEAGGVLSLEAVEDECPFTRLRQRFLMVKGWQAAGEGNAGAAAECYPPSEEAAITGHWPIPEGCDVEGQS